MTTYIVSFFLGGLLCYSLALHNPHRSRAERIFRFIGTVCLATSAGLITEITLNAVLT